MWYKNAQTNPAESNEYLVNSCNYKVSVISSWVSRYRFVDSETLSCFTFCLKEYQLPLFPLILGFLVFPVLVVLLSMRIDYFQNNDLSSSWKWFYVVVMLTKNIFAISNVNFGYWYVRSRLPSTLILEPYRCFIFSKGCLSLWNAFNEVICKPLLNDSQSIARDIHWFG